ncbi:MAG: biotin/lipoyl-containing protein, partial [Vicinamibacterales bacterium]
MSNVVVPQLGESVVEARIARWLKQPGDKVNIGDALVSLETDKVDVEVPADHPGTLVSIARQDGEDVKVGEVIGVLEPGEGAGAAAPAAVKATAPEAAKAADAKTTPTAKRMAEANQVKLDTVSGTGTAGRITKADVTQAMAPAAKAAPAPAPKAAAAAPAAPRPAAAPGSRTEDRVRMT